MNQLEAPYKKKIEKIGRLIIWEVDGDYVRTNTDIDFTNFGQHYRFSFIPKNEIWIDYEAHENERQFFIDNALAQYRLMEKGMSYDKAFKQADKIEQRERTRAGYITKAKHKAPAKPEEVNEQLIKKLDNDLRICIVDGSKVRDDFDIDFTEGGHDKVYGYIPNDTTWLDDDLVKEERPYILLHELHERRRMDDGWKYDKAHKASSKLEHKCRQNPKELSKALKIEGWDDDLKPLLEVLKMDTQNDIIEQLSNEIINVLFEAFYGHAGRPGMQGGSSPRGSRNINLIGRGKSVATVRKNGEVVARYLMYGTNLTIKDIQNKHPDSDVTLEGLADQIINQLFEGGSGSGNWGHAGRPGEVGGSQPGRQSPIFHPLLMHQHGRLANFFKSQKGSLTRNLFRAARFGATLKAFTSGSPRKMGRRLTNIAIGRKGVSHLYLKGKKNPWW